MPARKFLAIPAAVFVSLALLYAASPKARSVLSWTYLIRFIEYPRARPVTAWPWYQPLERVLGGDGVIFRKPRRTDPLGKDVRQKLEDFARESDSDAVLVVRSLGPKREPELLFEYVHPRPSRDFATDSNSMAKGPLGLLTGIAIAQGKLGGVTDLASKYLPEWSAPDDPRARITIGDLLEMASGLRNSDSRTHPLSDLAVMHLGSRLEPFALSIPSVEPPSQRYEYNNANSQVLSIILERAYGRRYASLLSELVWKPVAAWDAHVWLDHEGGLARTYCCLFARPHDWARIGLLLLEGGKSNGRQVVPKDWVKRIIAPSRLSAEFGSNIWLPRPQDKFDAEGVYYLSGLSEQNVWILPRQRIVIVRVGEKSKTWHWPRTYLPNLVAQALPRR